MVDADRLRIVFKVNGIGVVMPVADLLAIRGSDEDELTLSSNKTSALQLGSFSYRDESVNVYDLAVLLGLGDFDASQEHKLLVFAGSHGPWAVPVNDVSGVVNVDDFRFQDLPDYLFADVFCPYHQVALYQDQLLVSIDVRQVGDAWRQGE
jgi:chemotaxis signal transduction protein